MKERESMSNHQKQVSQAKEFKRELVAEVGGSFYIKIVLIRTKISLKFDHTMYYVLCLYVSFNKCQLF
jgi:hypothetical protein